MISLEERWIRSDIEKLNILKELVFLVIIGIIIIYLRKGNKESIIKILGKRYVIKGIIKKLLRIF